MRLLEVIPTPESDPAAVAAFSAFADRSLGKQVVFAHDTPNFIANRIGIAVMFNAANLMLQQGLTIEEVDALTGPAIGWPRTGTFRLADLVGIDILAHVAANFPEGVTGGKFSSILAELIKRGWLGDKSGQGFYKKIRGRRRQRRAPRPRSLHIRISSSSPSPLCPRSKWQRTPPRFLSACDSCSPTIPPKTRPPPFSGRFSPLYGISPPTASAKLPTTLPPSTRAMRAGFNWELGPFEMWDAAGVAATVARMKALKLPISAPAEKLLKDEPASASWYSSVGPQCFNPLTAHWEPIHPQPGHARVADFRRSNGVIRSNSGASLVDLGDGIACIELHSLKNAIGGDVLSFISSVLNPSSDAVRDFAAFVISGDRDNFSVGANLMQLLLAAQEGEWDDLAHVIHNFQQMTAAIKFCPRPVVAAPFGLALGGGAEICLHAARRQPHAETYMGLVEAGVGLIPAGGGTKEMLLRALDAAIALAPPDPEGSAIALRPVRRVRRRAQALVRTHRHGQSLHLRR